jgi:transcriptional regulator with XRE-family HTH domain
MAPVFRPNPICFHRERAGLSQDSLALQAGLTKEYLKRLELGTVRRWTVRLLPLAVLLDVPVGELVATS